MSILLQYFVPGKQHDSHPGVPGGFDRREITWQGKNESKRLHNDDRNGWMVSGGDPGQPPAV